MTQVTKNKPLWRQYKRFTAWVRSKPFLLALAEVLILGILECRKRIWLIRRSELINQYLRNHPIKKLQLGTYNNVLEGWLNLDVYPRSSKCVFLDATQPFPLKDNTFDYIFSEHMIENISYEEGLSMLKECFRILKPGGKIRITTPNLDTFIGLFSCENNDLQTRFMQWYMERNYPNGYEVRLSFIINQCFYGWNHRFIYDPETLKKSFKQAGFIEIKLCASCESKDEHFHGIDTHGTVVGNEEFNSFETMVLEAKLPDNYQKQSAQKEL
jgi:predicted SAM-dependent methyltransferase